MNGSEREAVHSSRESRLTSLHCALTSLLYTAQGQHKEIIVEEALRPLRPNVHGLQFQVSPVHTVVVAAAISVAMASRTEAIVSAKRNHRYGLWVTRVRQYSRIREDSPQIRLTGNSCYSLHSGCTSAQPYFGHKSVELHTDGRTHTPGGYLLSTLDQRRHVSECALRRC